jgi:hypothetical protein
MWAWGIEGDARNKMRLNTWHSIPPPNFSYKRGSTRNSSRSIYEIFIEAQNISRLSKSSFPCGVEFTDRLIVMGGLATEPARHAKVLRYLLLGWRPDEIAREIHYHVDTIYEMRANL